MEALTDEQQARLDFVENALLGITRKLKLGRLTEHECKRRLLKLCDVDMNFADGVEDGFGRQCFYDGRIVETYSEHGIPIFKHPTYNGYMREVNKGLK